MLVFGLVGFIGHPLYYWIWTQLYPQPRESLVLRLASALVCLPFVFYPWLKKCRLYNRLLPWLWMMVIFYELPFFFIYMSLLNDFSNVWALSTMAACLYLVLLVFDWMILLGFAVGGSLLAYVVAHLGLPLSAGTTPSGFLPLIPIYGFALLGGCVFNYKSELAVNERLAGITAAVETMAHELRTPLLGIRSGAEGLKRYLPALIDGYRVAQAEGLEVSRIRNAHFEQLPSVLERIASETRYSSAILDMLVVNATRKAIDSSSFSVCWMSDCVRSALERYPFMNDGQRMLVNTHMNADFRFFGSEVLTVHVLFNLLKNAIFFLEREGQGEIFITLHRLNASENALCFKDTGPGITPDKLHRIFERFYSSRPDRQGTGIGLAFARLVMRSFYGEITCRSRVDEFTEFWLVFPAIPVLEAEGRAGQT